jgi:hypothetical protein
MTITGVPREVVPRWLFRIVRHYRVRRFIGDVCVPWHPLSRLFYRDPTPREQMADVDTNPTE